MKYILLFFLISISCYSFSFQKNESNNSEKIDTAYVNELNNRSYKTRLTDPNQTISIAKKAKVNAEGLNYDKGIAEANRLIGIGYYYTNQRDSALNYYLSAISIFKKNNDQLGEAKVLNNIGNMWLEIDYDKALEYFNQTLYISKKLNNIELIAGANLNIGNVYFRKKSYFLALNNYKLSSSLFNKTHNSIGIIQSLQNIGVIYFRLNQIELAEKYLLEANKKAKENELNSTVAAINLSLTSIYISQEKYKEAEKYLSEGIAFSKLANDERKISDYTFTLYELEFKRKNFEKAIVYLKKVRDIDSVYYQKNTVSNINLIQQTLKQQQTQKENELIIENQRNTKKLFFAATAVAILSLIVIFLLIKTNKKSKKSNLELKALNDEVSKQKNNVERINQKLEEIIAERTKDLIIKNQKLSEYSSHLSHQIRAPIATLKGLVMLIQDGLVESGDVTAQIKKCVDEIDDQIMNINDALHDPSRHYLNKK